ncbi:hypothetical protein CRG98_002826 [Punica granatum]|uniref:Uncharacterized protein n=1 Tax=Punica granatum TaxID=22663 RepID=A0A2I0L872_PUNGR|nr:hypothetical protein CRG98_002826 [Punica granatum]
MASGDSFSRTFVTCPNGKVDTLKSRCIGARMRARRDEIRAAANCRALGARTSLSYRTDPRLAPFLS